MLVRHQYLMECKCFKVVEILVALVAVVVLVRVFLVAFHMLLSVKALVAVLVRAFDAVLCRHVGLFLATSRIVDCVLNRCCFGFAKSACG
jgi:hypothetical protein